VSSNEMIEMILDDAAEKMDGAVAHARKEFSTIRTGRASSALVEHLPVEAYGVTMSMQELASFAVPEARQLLITPHDPANIDPIDRAIQHAQLGLSPSNDGRVIRLSFPPLTEERRRDLARIVAGMAEDGKNRIRGFRRGARKELEDAGKSGGVSVDDVEWAEARLDEMTHQHEARIDGAHTQKEEELLEV
jgi:ribosome recycling factor